MEQNRPGPANPADPAGKAAAAARGGVVRVNVGKRDGDGGAVPIAERLLQRRLPGGRYLTKSKLTEGGMGIINVVHDQDLERILAMKIMPPSLLHKPELVTEFVTEARVTSQLQHPNIIPIHDIGIDQGSASPFYTMKLVEGESLLHIIDRLDADDPAYVQKYDMYALLSVFRKICDAIAYAHSRGVIHRDIKPENIMVGQFGEAILLDWGLAKVVRRQPRGEEPESKPPAALQEDLLDSSRTAAHGLVKGTLAYLSPEQAKADIRNVDRQTDVFLLGATLYHIVTRHAPYGDFEPAVALKKAEKAEYRHPRDWPAAADLPESLTELTLKAMAPDKKDRFASVALLIHDLDNHLAGRKVSTCRSYKPGEYLIRAGEIGSETYVVISGQVEISKTMEGTRIVLATPGEGAIIGELAGITQDVRTADVIAKEETEVLIISHSLLMQELRKLPPWMERIVTTLAERLTRLNSVVHPFMIGNCALPVLTQLYYVFCFLNEKPMGKTKVSVKLEGLVHEVSLNLGITSDRVQKILQVMLNTPLCTLDEFGRFKIIDMSSFREFLDYFGERQKRAAGVQLQTTGQKELLNATFDEIIVRLDRT
ncbi:MAG: hypothetical protein A3K19_10465 [Lentisphaerae bacterium RIFOXYB12_FULL_65_16]|nr:MAG: hypothetical protein A3K18_32325 [Lentisphaerae bacterium RIFOXYA12_64_32]OGV91637.1 MAG: hypothetical protein A3K19_10465 [Lentisphaerae bacterium RIFOXYB12_FULL_65_16]